MKSLIGLNWLLYNLGRWLEYIKPFMENLLKNRSAAICTCLLLKWICCIVSYCWNSLSRLLCSLLLLTIEWPIILLLFILSWNVSAIVSISYFVTRNKDFGVQPHRHARIANLYLAVLAFNWRSWNKYTVSGRQGSSYYKFARPFTALKEYIHSIVIIFVHPLRCFYCFILPFLKPTKVSVVLFSVLISK